MNDLIMVEEPYNILKNVIFSPNETVSAKVQNEYSLELEAGSMGCSEFGRHIAILGSMAVAKSFGHKEKYYYLATHANLKRKSNCTNYSKFFHLKAKTLITIKRTARIYGEIRDDENELLFAGTVEYQAISQPVFSKLYSKHKVGDKKHVLASPYINRKQLTNINIKDENIIGTYGKVEPSDCEGHFKDFPALPVAIIGGLFGELCMPLFKYHNPHLTKILCKEVIINAYRLAFSGEHITLEGRIDKRLPNDSVKLIAYAKVGDEIIADAHFELQAVYSPELVEMATF
ncbi:hypothetical protein [Saccharicrinis aurantiacus]|uniref:hypothetical protein n=1 Tax=Saccharicrinis aurantiacus TaxID=1849719 RepID=UPI0008386753|nr:hypothetical protein [Saccharicrinis aurantiacus]